MLKQTLISVLIGGTVFASGFSTVIHANDNQGQQDDHLPPGKGEIDWEKFCAKLTHTGFLGTFILELAGHEEQPVAHTLAEARQARLFLRDISRRMDRFNPKTQYH